MWIMKAIPMLITSQMLFSKTHMMILAVTIILAVIMSIKIFFMSLNYWLSFMIVFIYISGIMVLFMFIISLTPNEKTPTKSMKNTIWIVLLIGFLNESNSKSMILNNMKMSTSYKYNLFAVFFMLIFITVTSMIPPKTMLMMYKGMKSSK